MNLTEIHAILQEIGEGTVGEGNATPIFGDLGVATFRDDAPAIELANQLAERSALKIELENGLDRLGLVLVDDELLVLGIVAERRGAARPFAFFAGSRHLVLDAFGRKLSFELGKRQENVERQPPHRCGRIELLGHCHKRYGVGIEGLDQLCKIR
jgi:hypothetical protein